MSHLLATLLLSVAARADVPVRLVEAAVRARAAEVAGVPESDVEILHLGLAGDLDCPSESGVVAEIDPGERFSGHTRVKVRVGDPPRVHSATPIWPAANWLERECFDMFGVVFDGHPDLRRILMPEDFDAWPLRKEFPLKG